jgi:hypothetical protein
MRHPTDRTVNSTTLANRPYQGVSSLTCVPRQCGTGEISEGVTMRLDASCSAIAGFSLRARTELCGLTNPALSPRYRLAEPFADQRHLKRPQR